MEKKTSVNELLSDILSNINVLVDSSKTVGKPLIVDKDTALIPLSKVTYGFISGASQYPVKKIENKKNMYYESSEDLFPYGGASLGQVFMTPSAFIYISKGEVKMLSLEENKTLFEKSLELFKEVMKEQLKKRK